MTQDIWTRRNFLHATAVAGGAVVGGMTVADPCRAATQMRQELPTEFESIVPVTLRVNGSEHALSLDTRVTLLDALREHSADRNKERLRSRAMRRLHGAAERPAHQRLPDPGRDAGRRRHHHDRRARRQTRCIRCSPPSSRRTDSSAATAHRVRSAQRSACWPKLMRAGQAMSPASRYLPSLTDAEIAERMSGNLCRCAAYPNIVAAIRDVAEGDRG